MTQSDWAADKVALDRPNVARMWDYFLGGYHNFAIDRQAAERAIELYPDMPLVAKVTRAFLRRTVRFLLEQGIDQFLDIGSGMPTAGNVHEITQRINPAARVAYVDIDPVVIAHSQAILRDVGHAIAVQADVRRPHEVLMRPEIREFLDFSRPIGVLAIAILHFVPDKAEARSVLQNMAEGVTAGSLVVLTHATADAVDTAIAEAGEQNYRRANAPFHFRTHAEVAGLMEGLQLVAPGLVYLPQWRPDVDDDLLDQPERSANYGGVGLKR
ncbi:MAG TPA: SAM-dependent methyltransferase [Chloroflexota bacterium]|jgi:hypothetical protein